MKTTYLKCGNVLNDKDIGSVGPEWNWLVGWYKEPTDGKPKLIHYTEGGPWFEDYKDCEYAADWYKVEREYLNKELEIQKANIEQLFSDGKVADEDIEQKAKELEAIIQKIEAKEERWFELSAKIE